MEQFALMFYRRLRSELSVAEKLTQYLKENPGVVAEAIQYHADNQFSERLFVLFRKDDKE